MEPSTHRTLSIKAKGENFKPDEDLQLRTLLIHTRNQQRNTKRPTHHRILIMHTLTEPQRQIAHRLRNTLHLDVLVVREGVVLRGDAGMVDHRACVGDESGHGAAEVCVDLHYLFDGGGFEEG